MKPIRFLSAIMLLASPTVYGSDAKNYVGTEVEHGPSDSGAMRD